MCRSVLLLSSAVHAQADDTDFVDVVAAASPRKVMPTVRKALEQGAEGRPAAEALRDFITDVAGFKGGEHEHVRVPGDRAPGRLEPGDFGLDGGVQLEFACLLYTSDAADD